jgi:hypothetical protein
MAYSKAKLKSCGGKASPYFRPFRIGKLSEKYLLIWILLYVSFKHILISLTSFMGAPKLYENIVQYFPLDWMTLLAKARSNLTYRPK